MKRNGRGVKQTANGCRTCRRPNLSPSARRTRPRPNPNPSADRNARTVGGTVAPLPCCRRRQIGRGRLSAERHGAQERHGNGAVDRDGGEPVRTAGTQGRAVVARLARTCRHGCACRQTIRTANGCRTRRPVAVGRSDAGRLPVGVTVGGRDRSEPVGTVAEPVTVRTRRPVATAHRNGTGRGGESGRARTRPNGGTV